MQILVNGQPDLVQVDPGAVLQETLHQLRDWVRAEGLAIILLKLDGKVIQVDLPANLAAAKVDDYKTLELQVGRPQDLAIGVLEGLRLSLAKIESESAKATASFSRGDHAAALKSIEPVLEGWQAVLAAVPQVTRLCSLSPEAVGKAVPEEATGALREILTRIRGAMTDADFVSLGDLMSFELAPKSKDWERYLGTLIALVRATSPGADAEFHP